AEPKRDFAFDAQIDEIRRAQRGRRTMNGAAENRAAARMIDAHQGLHHFGRGRNLGAGNCAIGRLRQTVIGFLRGIGLGDRAGGGTERGGGAAATRPSRCTSHLAAKSGEVLTVSMPELCRCTRRSVPMATRSSASRTTARYSRPASVMVNRCRSRLKNLMPSSDSKAFT